jgi:hypothetical protein
MGGIRPTSQDCGGSPVWPRKERKNMCKDVERGGLICDHGRTRDRCKECGALLSGHGRRKRPECIKWRQCCLQPRKRKNYVQGVWGAPAYVTTGREGQCKTVEVMESPTTGERRDDVKMWWYGIYTGRDINNTVCKECWSAIWYSIDTRVLPGTNESKVE